MFKNKSQYGSFVISKHSNQRQIKKVAVACAFVLVAVLGTAFFLFKKDNKTKVAATSPIPQAQAAEIPGWWFKDYFGSSVCQKDNCRPEADPDNDGLTNAQEFYYHSNPLNRDTNSDQLTDGQDVAQGIDPSKPGKVTFAQAASDDTIVGESLVFDTDIRNLIADSVNPDKVLLPLPDIKEIKIASASTKQTISDYFKNTSSIIALNFPNDLQVAIESAISSSDEATIDDIKLRAAKTAIALAQVSVPSDAVRYHQYLLATFKTIPLVVNMPSSNTLNDQTNTVSNLWYDNTQAFMVLLQKMELETKRLIKAVS